MDAPYKLLTRQLPLSTELIETCNVIEHDGSNREPVDVTDEKAKVHSPAYLIEKLLSYPALQSAYADYEEFLGSEYEVNPDRGRLWSGEPGFTSFAEWKGIFISNNPKGHLIISSFAQSRRRRES
jgi:hypothetical protein